MAANAGSEAAVKNQTTMDLEGDREIVIRRAFNGPARIVFDAWTRPEHLRRWWAPASHCVTLESDGMREAMDQLDELVASL